MSKLILNILTASFIAIFFTGCVESMFSLGANKSYCEEHGCDYSDAGVCKDPYFVLLNKQNVKAGAYKGIDCYTNKDIANVK